MACPRTRKSARQFQAGARGLRTAAPRPSQTQPEHKSFFKGARFVCRRSVVLFAFASLVCCGVATLRSSIRFCHPLQCAGGQNARAFAPSLPPWRYATPHQTQTRPNLRGLPSWTEHHEGKAGVRSPPVLEEEQKEQMGGTPAPGF